MLENISKEYKKQSRETKFNKFYWITAGILIVIASVLNIPMQFKYYFIFINLIICVIIYFFIDYSKILKLKKVKKGQNLKNKINIYTEQLEKNRINDLIINIKKYNIKTKADLKLIIDYFNSEKPLKIESDYLGWIVSLCLTISSFIEIAYNPQTQTLDYTKISIILGTTLGYIIILVFIIGIIKLFLNGILIPKKKIISSLSQDLTYIYINFDKYKNQLSKKTI